MRIALFGMVGTGKTTLAKAIADQLGYEVFPEPIDNNPYFAKHYKSMKDNVFKMQIYMLTARSKQLIDAKNLKDVIFDRSVLEDPIFVAVKHKQKIMNSFDFKTYSDYYENIILPNLVKDKCFDLVIYLKVSTSKALERIKQRGRAFELEVAKEYWDCLNQYYDTFFELRKDIFDWIVIDSNNDNLEEKVQEILGKIHQKIPGLKRK